MWLFATHMNTSDVFLNYFFVSTLCLHPTVDYVVYNIQRFLLAASRVKVTVVQNTKVGRSTNEWWLECYVLSWCRRHKWNGTLWIAYCEILNLMPFPFGYCIILVDSFCSNGSSFDLAFFSLVLVVHVPLHGGTKKQTIDFGISKCHVATVSRFSHFDLGDVGRSSANKAWDCDYVSKTFPESRIRQEGGSSETLTCKRFPNMTILKPWNIYFWWIPIR